MESPKAYKVLACLALALSLAASFSLQNNRAIAQTASGANSNLENNLLIDWSTNTYVPPGYAGKALPIPGAQINAWVVLFTNGQPTDLSQYTIRWYAGSNLLASEQGDTSVSFRAPSPSGQIVNLQARVQSPSGNLFVGNIQVPVIAPIVAIASNDAGNAITGSSISLQALPYFFIAADPSTLSYAWTVNGTAAQTSGSSQNLTINLQGTLSSGQAVNVALITSNPSDSTTATAQENLTYQAL